jgi:PAT family beta-lactamase induction signal transducer AmpG
LFAFLGALASATQDVAIDAWRIDVADEQTSVELLSSIYQFGYRIASIVGGAGAGHGRADELAAGLCADGRADRADRGGHPARADTPRAEQGALHATLGQPGELAPRARGWRCWWWGSVGPGPSARSWRSWCACCNRWRREKHPSVAAFTRETGPLIVLATVAVPLLVSAAINALKARRVAVLAAPDPAHGPLRTALNHLYVALVAPLAELVGRLRWGVLIVIGMILTYTLCYNMWAASPFRSTWNSCTIPRTRSPSPQSCSAFS